MKIAFIGGGNMARAIIGGLVSKGVARAANIVAIELDAVARLKLISEFGVQAVERPGAELKSVDMVIFAVLIGLALYFRRKLDVHKRLMLLAAINLLTPAIARIPLDFIITGGPLAFFGLTDLVLLACVAFDTVKHRRLHPVFLWGSIFLIAMQPLRLLLAQTNAWMNVAAALVRLVS